MEAATPQYLQSKIDKVGCSTRREWLFFSPVTPGAGFTPVAGAGDESSSHLGGTLLADGT